VIEKLQELYGGYFSTKIDICKDLKSNNSDIFHCVHHRACEYIFKKEAFLTPFIGGCNGGNCDGVVMVVGEAPSGVNDSGLLIGGMFDNVGKENNSFSVSKSPVHWIRDFVVNKYKVTPFFVDAIKCGANKQKKEKEALLEKRSYNCLKEFLSKEIEILNPKIILCMGGMAFDFTKKAIMTYCSPGHEYNLVNLWHYSYRWMKKDKRNYTGFSNVWRDQINSRSISIKSKGGV
jgi:uracil-DNA glycosylase